MKKQFNPMVWYEEVKDGVVNMGFSEQFIHDVLGECFHITQSSSWLATKGKPLLTVETNEGLKTICSPVTGTVANFNLDARDFPDRLTPETVVMTIHTKKVEVSKPAPKKEEAAAVAIDNPFRVNWGGPPPGWGGLNAALPPVRAPIRRGR